jgi:hypothetical protein
MRSKTLTGIVSYKGFTKALRWPAIR